MAVYFLIKAHHTLKIYISSCAWPICTYNTLTHTHSLTFTAVSFDPHGPVSDACDPFLSACQRISLSGYSNRTYILEVEDSEVKPFSKFVERLPTNSPAPSDTSDHETRKGRNLDQLYS